MSSIIITYYSCVICPIPLNSMSGVSTVSPKLEYSKPLHIWCTNAFFESWCPHL